jgi:hypothetical protein
MIFRPNRAVATSFVIEQTNQSLIQHIYQHWNFSLGEEVNVHTYNVALVKTWCACDCFSGGWWLYMKSSGKKFNIFLCRVT